MTTRTTLALAALATFAAVTPATAQAPAPDRAAFVELLAGAAVPTFDIADVATTGPAFGAAVGYRLSPRIVLMGEIDYGMHQDKATESVDISTLHLIGKIGWSLTGPRDRGWETVLNLGAGSVTFDVDGAPNSFTYFAINAGAKISYAFNPRLAFVLSPQGDIAFAKRDELTTDNAWVWPVTAGIRLSF
jgi:hypothetical protein